HPGVLYHPFARTAEDLRRLDVRSELDVSRINCDSEEARFVHENFLQSPWGLCGLCVHGRLLAGRRKKEAADRDDHREVKSSRDRSQVLAAPNKSSIPRT